MSRVTRSVSSPVKPPRTLAEPPAPPPSKKRRLQNVPPPAERDVLIAPKGVDVGTLLKLRLPQPKTGTQAIFLASPDLSSFHELLQWQEPCRSFLFADALQKDARILFTVPIDPVLIVIRYIKLDASDVFRSLDDLLAVKEFPDLKRLLSSKRLHENVANVADVREVSDEVVVKFSWQKFSSWLESKLHRLDEKLKCDIELAPQVRLDEAERKRYAFGILCDYVPSDLHADLKKHFAISEPVAKHTDSKGSPTKKGKKKHASNAENTPMEDYFREDLAALKVEERKLTPVQKKLAKASSGTKSLASFFGKANPKK